MNNGPILGVKEKVARTTTKQINVPCTPEDYRAFKQLSKARHLPLATLIKLLMYADIDALKRDRAA